MKDHGIFLHLKLCKIENIMFINLKLTISNYLNFSREQASCGDIPDVISAPAPASSSTPTPSQHHPSPVKVNLNT